MSNIANNQVVVLLARNRKRLLTIAAVSAVLSTIASFVITPLYRSQAVIYPSNVIPMGTETPTEQMMQVLQSDVVRDSVVRLFNLYAHYGIDTSSRAFRSAMSLEYSDHVSIEKTQFESVVLEVMDEDPVVARDMVNSIINFFNQKSKLIQKQKSIEVVKILSNQLAVKKAEMDSMEAVLTDIRQKYGILDYSLQTEYATERYLQVVTQPGLADRAKFVEPLLNALKEKGGEFTALNEHLWRIRGKYNDLKEQREQAIQDVEKTLTFCSVIVAPEVADKKAYPIRWLIVSISVLATVFVSLIFLSVYDDIRGLKDQVEA